MCVYIMPRRKKTLYVWGDSPEIQAVGAGFAQQAHYTRGHDAARMFGNGLAMKATAVPADQKAQIAFLAGRYGDPGEGAFLQPITGKNLQTELGLSRHYLNAAFDKNISKTHEGLEYSNIHGLDLMRAYKIPAAMKASPAAVKASPFAIGAQSLAAIYERNAPALQSRKDATRAIKDWRFEAKVY
jgi:hypothetical protein